MWQMLVNTMRKGDVVPANRTKVKIEVWVAGDTPQDMAHALQAGIDAAVSGLELASHPEGSSRYFMKMTTDKNYKLIDMLMRKLRLIVAVHHS